MAQTIKNLPAKQETWVWSLGREDPLRKKMASTPVLLPENPMDRGAWWATVHRVTKSQTWLRERLTLRNFLDYGAFLSHLKGKWVAVRKQCTAGLVKMLRREEKLFASNTELWGQKLTFCCFCYLMLSFSWKWLLKISSSSFYLSSLVLMKW